MKNKRWTAINKGLMKHEKCNKIRTTSLRNTKYLNTFKMSVDSREYCANN